LPRVRFGGTETKWRYAVHLERGYVGELKELQQWEPVIAVKYETSTRLRPRDGYSRRFDCRKSGGAVLFNLPNPLSVSVCPGFACAHRRLDQIFGNIINTDSISQRSQVLHKDGQKPACSNGRRIRKSF
jgi:hypothetical protein